MPIQIAHHEYLQVPVALDALWVPEPGTPTIDPFVDAQTLPYLRQKKGESLQARNEGTAYLSENIVSQPFTDKNAFLEPGIHLHWALPDALTQGKHRKQKDGQDIFEFPEVPNRWLLIRKSKKRRIPAKAWLVLSDYLWPEGLDLDELIGAHPGEEWPYEAHPGGHRKRSKLPERKVQRPYVTYHHQTPDGINVLPYRYLGQVHTYEPGDSIEWENQLAGSSPLSSIQTAGIPHKLTSLGYGDPLFSALYSNCRGVFGLWDDLSDLKDRVQKKLDLTDIEYEVFGWHHTSATDVLHQFVQENNPEQYGAKDMLEALQKEFGWTLPEDQQTLLPGRILCRGSLQFTQDEAPATPKAWQLMNNTKTPVAIGHNGTEALSAFLAHKMTDELALTEAQKEQQRLRLENQLESLHLQASTENQFADLGPIFEEARHSKTFQPVSGGRLWALRPETARQSGQASLRDFYTDAEAAILFLPPGLHASLDQVNQLQSLFNQSNAGIDFLRQQIFTDWHKYMSCCYHEEGADYPDIDEARLHTVKLIDLLSLLKLYTGKIMVRNDQHRIAQPYPDVGSVTFKNKEWILQGKEGETKINAPTDLLHLLPNTVPGFSAWCQQLDEKKKEGDSIAQQIVDLLNQIQVGLNERSRLINSLREQKNRISSQKNPTQDQLIDWAKALDAAVISKNQDVQQADLRAVERIQALQDDSPDQVQKTLLQLVTPLAAIPLIHLEPIKGPRYWEPKEPALLLTGPAVATTDRHGMDGKNQENGYLICYPQSTEFFHTLLQKADCETDPAFSRSSDGNPWHALFFEWEVRIDGLAEKSNRDPDTLAYASDFISSQFTLTETKSEFLAQQPNAVTQTGNYTFTGRSILLPYAEEQLETGIADYLIQQTRQFLQHKKTSTTHPLSTTEKSLLQAGKDKPEQRAAWLQYYHTNRQKVVDYANQQFQEALTRYYLGTPILSEDETEISKLEKNRRALIYSLDLSTIKMMDVWQKDRSDILAWLREKSDQDIIAESPIHAVMQAEGQLDALKSQGIHLQSQVLSGFNAALLMLKQEIQLEIAEPNAPKEYQAFSSRVTAAVGRQNLAAPYPLLDFHPLRSGQMTITRLRIVDTFGRVYPIIDRTTERENPSLVVPDRMKGADGGILLSPRITQAARIHLRWQAADANLSEVNAHPHSSPICAWVVLNHLDHSLMFYDGTGEVLGSIDQTGRWRIFPGQSGPLSVSEIANPCLRKWIRWIIQQANLQSKKDKEQSKKDKISPGFISMLIDKWEKILEGIDPAGFAQHKARSLLMGRPIALVQASVDLQLKAWPAIHQDWLHYRRVLAGQAYLTDGFTKVKIPIRIGEHQRLNDGVVSFWLDEQEGYYQNQMYDPRASLSFMQTIEAPPQHMVVLMDPRGLLHCTTGVLPTKAISIPREQYTAALKKIQVAFLTSPVLSDPEQLNVSLPQEPGFSWAWLEQIGNKWSVLTEQAVLKQDDVQKAFPNGADIWRQLLQNGMLKRMDKHANQAFLLKAGELAKVVESISKKNKAEKKRWENIIHVLGMLSKGIKPPYQEARFGPTQVIREGWLALRPTTGFDDEPLS